MASNIEKFNASGSKIVYEGIEINLKPMTVREQAKFAELVKKEQMDSALQFIFVCALKSHDPTFTEDEILSIRNPKFFSEVVEPYLELHGIKLKGKEENFQQSN